MLTLKTTWHRLALVATFAAVPFISVNAFAQETFTELAVPTPPGAKIVFEVDARQDDVLGIFKSLVQTAQSTLKQDHVDGQPVAENSAFSPEWTFLQYLAQQDFSKVLKDVNHVHVVVFRRAVGPDLRVTESFEAAWKQEGGRRIAYMNDGPNQSAVMVGFANPRSFAICLEAGPDLFVVRADGYPDLDALVPIFYTFFKQTMLVRSMVVEAPVVVAAPPAMVAKPIAHPPFKPYTPKAPAKKPLVKKR